MRLHRAHPVHRAQPERAAKAKPANAPMPSSVNEIEAYKRCGRPCVRAVYLTLCRAMIERYEAQQRENAAILAAKKKSTQG